MITSKKASVILTRYNELTELCNEFTRFKTGIYKNAKIDRNDWHIFCRENTSCHCHPEYEDITVGTFEEFCKWLDNNQKGDK